MIVKVRNSECTMRAKKQINVEIGESVKAVREERGMTQEQLAERIDVSVQFVSDLERGVTGVSLATLKNICTVLGVSSDRILFNKTSGPDTDLIANKCRALTPQQMKLLADIVDRFVEAVESERRK